MLLTKRSKDNRRKEIESAIIQYRRDIETLRQISNEFKNKYLPVRDKCVEMIRSYNLGRYKLADVLSYKFEDDGTLRIVVYMPKEEYWDGELRLNYGDKLLDEIIPINIPESYLRFTILAASYAVGKLRDPEPNFVKRINTDDQDIIILERELDELNKK